ncbi:MAG: hypothetical protein COV67_08940, partial [Nitrospinae bacterium CG11_big_fil_rev_8_21_14_0_20_56_8]
MFRPSHWIEAMRIDKAGIMFLVVLGFLCFGKPPSAFGQIPEAGTAAGTQVEKIRIGPHPEFTRILIDLNQPADYKVEADFKKKLIILSLPDASLGEQAQSRTLRDKNLQSIQVATVEGRVQIQFLLQQANTRFFHYLEEDPNRIVVDFQGLTTPILKTKIKEGAKTTGEVVEEDKGKPRVKGMTLNQVAALVQKDTEEKLKQGWDDYQKALLSFQQRNYREAAKMFREYIAKYPESSYLSHIAYLNAEAEFNAVFTTERNPIFTRALEAYKWAARKFPDSRFHDHTLFKIADIYDRMGYTLEARTLYQEGLKRDPKSLYNDARKSGLANMLMKEGRYDEAYGAFQVLLKESPKNQDAKTALFDIANHYFEQKSYDKAIKIYEDGADRWPGELNERPEINSNMGDIYFAQKDYENARKHFFDLINLAPEAELAHRALNRIGDSYMLEGKDLSALSVFDESSKLNPGTALSQYGVIRMADIGVRNPRLPVQDVLLDVTHYFQPFKTYDTIAKEADTMDVLAEVTLSKGLAFMREQNYLNAIEMFKKLLPLGAESRFYQEAAKYIRQSLTLLVDRYSRQSGFLPILYAYSDYVGLRLGDITNLKALLEIGEAYQSVGMYQEALNFYEKVKEMDSRETYTDRLFLNLGQIHLTQGNTTEAELVARSFLKNYSRSDRVPDALKLLADSLKLRGRHEEALEAYEDLRKHRKANVSEAYYLIGEVNDSLKKPAESVQAYRN